VITLIGAIKDALLEHKGRKNAVDGSHKDEEPPVFKGHNFPANERVVSSLADNTRKQSKRGIALVIHHRQLSLCK